RSRIAMEGRRRGRIGCSRTVHRLLHLPPPPPPPPPPRPTTTATIATITTITTITTMSTTRRPQLPPERPRPRPQLHPLPGRYGGRSRVEEANTRPSVPL